MMATRTSLLIAFITLTLIGGCEKPEQPTPPASKPAPVLPPATVAPSTASSESPRPPSVEATPRAAITPEELTVDTDRDPLVRARAKAVNAKAVADMKSLKPGDEVLMLVRGDKGGGPIYGSGPYTLDSAIRKAVIHAGLLQDRQLGLVQVKVIKHDGDHPSIPANGITPTAWSKYHVSYTLEKAKDE